MKVERQVGSARALSAQQTVAPLTLRLWGLDWSRIFPHAIDDGVVVDRASFEDAVPFIQQHYPEIFGNDENPFLAEPMTPAKRLFLSEADVFLFREGTKTFGLFIGHPTDWSTYYIRTAAFTAEYRARGYMRTFLEPFWPALAAAGVARVESDVSPANAPVLALHAKEGFVATSMTTSERWGSLTRLTKFLDAEAHKVFSRQFCSVPARTVGSYPKQ